MTSTTGRRALGRYQLLSEIGRGGMATVFKALDPHLNRHVAVKVIRTQAAHSPAFVQMFRREARAVASLTHPHIVTVHDFGEQKGFTYFVMEYLTGGTLSRKIALHLTLPETTSLVRPLAAALDYAHSRGIVHRDIKPANVLLDAAGQPKLADFGIASILAGSTAPGSRGSLRATPEFLAPELALGRPADHRSDLYSFGVMIYQMLLEKSPFVADTAYDTMMAHVNQQVPRVTEIDPGSDPRLEPIILKALAKDPDHRYQTAGELVEALASLSTKPSSRRAATQKRPVRVVRTIRTVRRRVRRRT